MFRYIVAIVAIAIAAAPRNVAADFNPARLRLHGISDSDFDRGVDPATLLAAKTSSRELSGTIVWSDYQVGSCISSTGTGYPVASKVIPATGLSLEDWCKAWCASVQPDKVVGMTVWGPPFGVCYCFFDAGDLPDDLPTLPLQYDPPATNVNTGLPGTGCITRTTMQAGYKCYRNCAYKQCNNASGYTSCPITTTTTTAATTTSAANTSKSGKPSSPGPKAGKGSNPMLLADEGSFSMPTEFNEWGNEFNEWGDIVSMSMENEESTIGV